MAKPTKIKHTAGTGKEKIQKSGPMGGAQQHQTHLDAPDLGMPGPDSKPQSWTKAEKGTGRG